MSTANGHAPALSRVSAVLPTEAVEELRESSAKKGDNLTQGLKAAIKTKVFLDDEIDNGGTVLVKRKDGSTVEIKLP
jgi:hypothetical protein